jgi:hypothetical protein
MIEREPEDEVADLERAAEKVQDDIEETQSDWDSKKGDESVPGAVGDDDLGHDTFAEGDDAGG